MDNSLNRRALLAIAGASIAAPSAWAQDAGGWRTLPTEPYNGKQDDIYFVDALTGWYGNGAGKLYRTQDGGETWALCFEQPGTFIRALGFASASVGYLGNVGVGYYPGVTDPHPLYQTRDAGASWTPITANGIEAVAGICGIDVQPIRLIHQGELRETHMVHAAGRVGGPAAMLRSIDGGETWSTLDLSAHAGMILDVRFFDQDNGLVCAATNSAVETARAAILATTDGGRSWTRVYEGERPLENCWKMSFPTREIGYATVQSYDQTNPSRIFIKTTDGGQTWRELPLTDDPAAREFGIGFASAERGWIGTARSGFETRDGGMTWLPVSFGRAVNKIRVVSRPDGGQRAFAIGVEVHRLDL